MTDFHQDIDAIAAIPAVPMILEVICRTTGMGFAAITRISGDRWIACAVRDTIGLGILPGEDLPFGVAVNDRLRDPGNAMFIDDIGATGLRPGAADAFRSVASVPVVLPDGTIFGTLCALSPQPSRVEGSHSRAVFTLCAELISLHLDRAERRAGDADLASEYSRGAEPREQFIAVLGHDLRNPLAALEAGTGMLLRTPLDDKGTKIVGLMQDTIARMGTLIENVLDFARARSGVGVAMVSEPTPIEAELTRVVGEHRSARPGRIIETEFAINCPVVCDGSRIGQLLSNLLANAIVHGDAQAPIRVRAAAETEAFELSVLNFGAPIQAAAIGKLFQPFYRGEIRSGLQGLGLGLYIAAEIARAHRGEITVSSSDDGTCFTFRMPNSLDRS